MSLTMGEVRRGQANIRGGGARDMVASVLGASVVMSALVPGSALF